MSDGNYSINYSNKFSDIFSIFSINNANNRDSSISRFHVPFLSLDWHSRDPSRIKIRWCHLPA